MPFRWRDKTLSMETLKDILWPIIAVGGLGAFIDFLIGKTGQEKAKDFLLKWWLRFDDVRWNNFGREEGFFAARLMDRWLGRRLFSIRRILSAFIICFLFVGGTILSLLISGYSKEEILCYYCRMNTSLNYWY